MRFRRRLGVAPKGPSRATTAALAAAAAAIAYLASPLAGATTGTALAVDGGMQGLRTRPRPA